MEGGVLNHAARIGDGTGIYVAPSLDFIPFLYTPLYPGLLATLEPVFGLSYQTGRAISILAILGVIVLGFVALVGRVDRRQRRAAWVGAALAAGLFAATYAWVDGWFDLVRGDMLCVTMAVGGLTALHAWARSESGWRGQARIAVAAAILALSFFCKQTGVFYVAAGGAALLVLNWRRLPVFVGVAGFIGLGGAWLLNRTSGGWFWTYAFKVHQTHHCNPDRFDDAFGQIFWHFPAMTAVLAVGVLVVALAWITRRARPPSSGPFLFWLWVFAVSVVLGAVGIATQWSHRNAYIPAMVTGAIAAGAALPALAGALTALGKERRGAVWRHLPPAAALAAAGALAVQLVLAWWSPKKYIPTAADRAAGDRLIEMIRNIDGDVFIPYHPWYGHLAGKRVFTHRMGVLDMRYRPPPRPTEPECFFAHSFGRPNWPVRGLPDWFRDARFAAIIWDRNTETGSTRKDYFQGLEQSYRLDDLLPAGAERGMRPRTVTGAKVVPYELWVPSKPTPPPNGAEVLFDFENGSLAKWDSQGTAWGKEPTAGPIRHPRQGPVRRYGGRYFVSSFHGGDKSTGTLTSPVFQITGERITFRMSGGGETAALAGKARPGGAIDGHDPWLRIELRVDGIAVRYATNPAPGSERMVKVEWNVPEYIGKKAVFVLVDNARGSWGHLNADDFWMWKK